MAVIVKTVNGAAHDKFNHAVSVIMDHVSAVGEKDLALILDVQNGLLKFTLSRINRKRRAHSAQ